MVIGSALIQEFEGKESVIYYLSRRLMLRPGIRQLKNYVYAYTFHVLSRDIICYRPNALLYAKMM